MIKAFKHLLQNQKSHYHNYNLARSIYMMALGCHLPSLRQSEIRSPVHLKKESFFSRTKDPIILKCGMHNWGLKLYKGGINDYSGLTLAYFMARSNLVVYV